MAAVTASERRDQHPHSLTDFSISAADHPVCDFPLSDPILCVTRLSPSDHCIRTYNHNTHILWDSSDDHAADPMLTEFPCRCCACSCRVQHHDPDASRESPLPPAIGRVREKCKCEARPTTTTSSKAELRCHCASVRRVSGVLSSVQSMCLRLSRVSARTRSASGSISCTASLPPDGRNHCDERTITTDEPQAMSVTPAIKTQRRWQQWNVPSDSRSLTHRPLKGRHSSVDFLMCHTSAASLTSTFTSPFSSSLLCPMSSSSSFWSLTAGMWMTRALFLTLIVMSSAISPSAGSCKFPPEWEGHWFQKGVPDPIRISESDISEKGSCREIAGDKFLIENRQERCIRCMVINQKHGNVLQYKETFCFPYQRTHRRHLRDVCADINGDAPLYSLFRLDTPAVACPFAGPFRFAYSRGHGECREPLSSIDSCTEDSRLLFRFQACADVVGSESRVEELSCVGEWKEGSVRYLVGKLEHRSAKTDEDKFRCFVFEKSSSSPGGLAIAQSGDATCDGLSSSIEGSRTMRLEPSDAVQPSCTFPKFLTVPQNWRTLDGTQVYRFHQNSTFSLHNTSTGQVYTTVTCVRDLTSPDQSYQQFAVHAVSGCKIGFMCIRVHRRNHHIVELEGSNHLAKDEVDACSQHQQLYQNYVSITTFQPSSETCPNEGIYSVEVPSGDDDGSPTNSDAPIFICSEQSLLTSRCTSEYHMQLLSKCSDTSDSTRNFYCHGTWQDNDTAYTIVYSWEDKKQYCLTHSTSAGEQVLRKMTINSGSCPHPSTARPAARLTSGPAFPAFAPSLTSQSEILHAAKQSALVLNIQNHGKCQSAPSTGAASASPALHIHIKYSVFVLNLSLALPLIVFNFAINKL